MNFDWLDDSIDHEVERMISEIRLPKWLAKLTPPPGLGMFAGFAWASKRHQMQLERMMRYRERKKLGLVPPRLRKLTPAQKRARNRKHSQAYRDRQPKKPKPDRVMIYGAYRQKRHEEDVTRRFKQRPR